ncbi:MAG: potassium-transporting ATPase subunit KdpB [Chthoniobacteraceae bacterium]
MKTQSSIFDPKLLTPAIADSFKKLDPRVQWKNPVMFVVFLGSIITTWITLREFSSFHLQLTLWLWFTVLFANFAEAMAEGRGKAQAATLRKMRTTTMARRIKDGLEMRVAASELHKGDTVVCEAGDVIPGDGEIVEGIASVDESAITGESAPVIRESGGDRSAVTGGTRVISDRVLVKITSEPGSTFIDRMISLVEGARRQKTPNEIALGILLVSLTVVFLLAVFTLPAFASYSLKAANQTSGVDVSMPVLIALLVCLIPTTIGALLSAIGISGIDRLVRRNVLATSGRAVEAAGDIDVLLLDKTGTITMGNRMAVAFHAAPGVEEGYLAASAQLSSLADETPEGRSVVVLAKEKYNLRAREMHELQAEFVPFTAQTRMSGVDLPAREDQPAISIRKGAAESVKKHVEMQGGTYPAAVAKIVDDISKRGGTPLVVVEGWQTLGVIELKDIVKGGIKERFAQLRQMGIRTVMITGDNPLTAAAIAAEAGVDDFMAQATPEDKLARIREEQGQRPPGRDDRRRHQRRARAGAIRCRRRHEYRHASRPRGRQHGGPG